MSGAKKLKYRKVVASTQLRQGASQHGQAPWSCPDPMSCPEEWGPLLPWWAPSYQSPSVMSAHSRALPNPCSKLSVARMPAYT